MKILFVADGRSAIALNWIRYFVEKDHEVHLVSVYPGAPDLNLTSYTFIPVAFSGAAVKGTVGTKVERSPGSRGLRRKILQVFGTPKVRTWLRHIFVPQSLPSAALKLGELIKNLQPDIIHAMRVPYEGMLVTAALSLISDQNQAPFLLSIWGNDFTLHANSTRRMTQLTRATLQRADALHTDCYRDQPLAHSWGFGLQKLAIIIPGAGGIQRADFQPGTPESPPIVFNPRGLRAYVRNDTFFQAIPKILASHPEVRFVCSAMQGQPEAERWVETLGIQSAVTLLPAIPRREMAAWFQKSQIVVSPSIHDGTPNTLLEGLASGCFPVVGDIETLREWITPGVNGLLFDPADPQELAEAVILALNNSDLRTRAKEHNLKMINERADYNLIMPQAAAFYTQLKAS
jgi:glycosyltransferase involved in cell wall biosynthesis